MTAPRDGASGTASARWWKNAVVAGCVLFAVYLALSFVNDPRGYFVSDTGGRVATVRSLERNGGGDPDLGYWAQRWDPQGRLHPFSNAQEVGGKWVTVGTLPTIYLGYPFWVVAGYRGLLVWSMLGAVAAAFAARQLARRFGAHDDGWAAFWMVGLASPVLLYALEAWDHALGLGLLAWGLLLLLRATDATMPRRGVAGRAAAGGILLGAATTLRTEAFVYAFVIVLACCARVAWRDRRPRTVLLVAIAVGLAALVPLLANQALEHVALGESLRSGRAAGYASKSASSLANRVDLMTVTSSGIVESTDGLAQLLGLALGALLTLAALKAGTVEDGIARIAGLGAMVLYLVRCTMDLGFVPGLLSSTPLAAVGVAVIWRHPQRRLAGWIAVMAVPLVWMTQAPGGFQPIWSARYLLLSGLVLGVAGVVALPELPRWARRGAVLLAVGVTAYGFVWMSVRTHEIGRVDAALGNRPEPVLVSRVSQLFTEAGDEYRGQRWLSAESEAAVRDAGHVVLASGHQRFALIELDERSARVVVVPGFCPTARHRIRFVGEARLVVTTFVARGDGEQCSSDGILHARA